MRAPRGRLLLTALVAAAACSPESPTEIPSPPPAMTESADELRRGDPSTWIAEWTWLVFAANDDRDPSLVAAFDDDAIEWQRGLGGSALFRILVERDYAPFQDDERGIPGRPSERYSLYREERRSPDGKSDEVLRLGETDTSDPKTLRDFLVAGVRAFPARHYWITITGHGDGFAGLADDATSGEDRRLSLADLAAALGEASRVVADEIRQKPGLGGPGTSDRIDVVAFDTCRLGSIEVASALSDVADYMIASREAMPNSGHPYTALKYIAQDHPGASARALVKAVVTDYVRAYVEGVSTAARAYVGTSITSIGLDLRRIPALEDAIDALVAEVLRERPRGFSCKEVSALFADACGSAGIVPPNTVRGRARTAASDASVDLVALLERLADPARCSPGDGPSPSVSHEVVVAAAAVLDLIGRPPLRTKDEPEGVPLLYGGQYRRLGGFAPESPFVIEAQRIEPRTGQRLGGLGVLWGNPYELLMKRSGVSLLDTYRKTRFESHTGWTNMLAACIEQAEACRTFVPNPDAPDEDPCAGL